MKKKYALLAAAIIVLFAGDNASSITSSEWLAYSFIEGLNNKKNHDQMQDIFFSEKDYTIIEEQLKKIHQSNKLFLTMAQGPIKQKLFKEVNKSKTMWNNAIATLRSRNTPIGFHKIKIEIKWEHGQKIYIVLIFFTASQETMKVKFYALRVNNQLKIFDIRYFNL